ncbi:hypothetical protein DSO57_1039115 [Entomophthora muscae]|uniref:Uncharacterized protein n=1 Tax=Entomophthora muscae TaxID=34485 RepID=A0ACC2U8D0_9FUNG|nr:hypothetical protein DSO57_1039115 [Entomophthora muscae]
MRLLDKLCSRPRQGLEMRASSAYSAQFTKLLLANVLEYLYNDFFKLLQKHAGSRDGCWFLDMRSALWYMIG